MVDYRDFAIELTEEMGFSEKDMLVAALKWMSLDDVKGMLEANEYPMSCEEDEDLQARDEEMQEEIDQQIEEDLLARYPNAIAELEVLKKDFLGMAN